MTGLTNLSEVDRAAVRFHALFAGRGDALGSGAGRVDRRTVCLQDYVDHLSGIGEGIGIFPMLDTNEVNFAAIDLDEPNFELAQSFQLMLPGRSFIERSRSGNAHVWVFFERPGPAWAARTILRGATQALGRNDVEIFPKQDQLREGMVGNYINLPYFGADRPILKEAALAARPYTLNGFLNLAERSLQDPDAWVRRARALGGQPPAEREDTSEWGGAPVLHGCAQHIIEGALDGSRPIMPGSRHQVFFHLAKQLLNWRDLKADEARDLLEEVNAASPKPLHRGELERLFVNAYEGQYTSTGCDDPVMHPYILPDCPIGSRS